MKKFWHHHYPVLCRKIINGFVSVAMIASSIGTPLSVVAQEQLPETTDRSQIEDTTLGYSSYLQDSGDMEESDSGLNEEEPISENNFPNGSWEGMEPTEDLASDDGVLDDNVDSDLYEDTEDLQQNSDLMDGDTQVEDPNMVYTLELRHSLSFKVNGQTRNVTASETHFLNSDDFVDGEYDLKQLSSVDEHLMVTDADILTQKNFNENGIGSGTISYAVNDSYRVTTESAYESGEPIVGTVFEGVIPEDYKFIPANIIRLKVNYKYSSTGGLSGINAFNSEVIEVNLDQLDGKYEGSYSISNRVKEGFRLVLDPIPLNEFVINPPLEGEDLSDEEIQKRLENGDFNVNINNPDKPVYWYQENNLSSDTEDTNGVYGNKYSTAYNEAWNEARILSEEDPKDNEEESDGGNTGISSIVLQDNPLNEQQGANPLSSPNLKFELTQKKFDTLKDSSQVLEITIFYRRNATWYIVNHWVPSGFSQNENTSTSYGGQTYFLNETEEVQGRAGAVTNAKAKIGEKYELLSPLPISQHIIQNRDSKNVTTVNIYYNTATSYRVIFDTSYAYIPRQQVPIDSSVSFPDNDKQPKRKGYKFVGWQYIEKNTQPSEEGSLAQVRYVDVDTQNGKPYLKIDAAFLQKVELTKSGDAVAIHLYPKWEVDTTQIRVVLWTENLNGTNDVQAKALGEATTYYDDIYKNFEKPVQTQSPTDENKTKYSNQGSFTLTVQTESILTNNGSLSDSVTLYDNNQNILNNTSGNPQTISDEVNQQFEEKMGRDEDIPISQFYTLSSVEVINDDGNQTTASANGHTVINIYFTRNIYELLFTYYGSAWSHPNYEPYEFSNYCIALNTTGYSKSTYDSKTNSSVTSAVNDKGYLDYDSQYGNYENNRSSMSTAPTVPKTITIRAKYGADLREVWPVARAEEHVTIKQNNGGKKYDAKMISWTPLAGKYWEKANQNRNTTNKYEPTIHGSYAAMTAEIIADPTRPVTNPNAEIRELRSDEDNPAGGFKNNLVAYWFNGNVSYYRYNHCGEIPTDASFNLDNKNIVKVKISDGQRYTNGFKDYIYLIPTDDSSFNTYQFDDLLEVKLATVNGMQVVVSVNEDSNDTDSKYKVIFNSDINSNIPEDSISKISYYAIRKYQINQSSSEKYFALLRQISTVSSNSIDAQNPSKRDHMQRVNSIADHSQDHLNNHGVFDGDHLCGNTNRPYDLFFYYERDRYHITYMVPCNNENAENNEIELGTIELPYGTQITKKQYAIPLSYTNKITNGWTEFPNVNGENANIAVCPDRNENGQAVWTFKGWSLGSSEQNMLWTKNDNTTNQFSGEEFPLEGNLIIYAIWQRPDYLVRFDLDGGEVTADVQTEVKVPANTKFTSNSQGSIPRPLKSGYTFEGWYEIKDFDEDGNLKDNAQQFDFEQQITADKNLRALWKLSSDQTFQYTVYYVTPTDSIDDKTIWIGEDNEISTAPQYGYSPYKLLSQSEPELAAYTEGIVLNLSPKNIEGYIPKDTSLPVGTVKPDGDVVIEEDGKYNIIFIYNPISKPYNVKFCYVLAGTETQTMPEYVIDPISYQTDKVYPTPGIAQTMALTTLGYHFVNKKTDSAPTKYIPIKSDDGKGIKWIDKDGKDHIYDGTQLIDMDSYKDRNGDVLITFLVEPTIFNISYKVGNIDGKTPSAELLKLAETALDSITPPDSEEIFGDPRTSYINPNRYLPTNNTILLTNPPHVYDSESDKWYKFTGWTRGEKTNIKSEKGEQIQDNNPTCSLAIGKGSIGNLEFIANWEEETEFVKLIVSKKVDGNFGDRKKAFDFTLKLSERITNNQVSGSNSSTIFEYGYPSTPYSSSVDFQLSHGQRKELSIPKKLVYEVKETKLLDYEQSYTIVPNESSTDPIVENEKTDITDFGPSDQIINEDTTVSFKNTKNIDKPVTGITNHNSTWIVVLAGGITLIAILLWMKKYKYEKE